MRTMPACSLPSWRVRRRSAAEIEAFNEQARGYPQDEAGRQRHQMLLEEAGYAHRTDITTMFDRLDLDDGRDVPLRS